MKEGGEGEGAGGSAGAFSFKLAPLKSTEGHSAGERRCHHAHCKFPLVAYSLQIEKPGYDSIKNKKLRGHRGRRQ